MVTVKTRSYQYEKVASHIRETISKEYVPGDLIAPERELAKRFSVSHMTLRKALDVLAQEGVIHRHQGRGTIVSNRLATGEFAIVLRPHLLSPEASPYYRVTSTAIMESIQQHNSRWAVKMHLGKMTATGTEFPATLDLLEPDVLRRLRGVFSFHPLWGLEEKLQAAKVPVVALGSRKDAGNYQVGFDTDSLYQQAVSHLQEVGCRRIGLLWAAPKRQLEASEQSGRRVAELAAGKGMECRPEWMPFHPGDITERGGYELFMRFWHQTERPDGVLVDDDILCRGVLRAILQLGIKMPDHLRLITIANKHVELPYHLPVSRVEVDAMEQARCAAKVMIGLMDGQPPEQNIFLLPGQISRGSTT